MTTENRTIIVPELIFTEMGQFVDETLSKENLSKYAASQRLNLLEKLRVYLPESFPILLSSSYLDMNAGASKGNSALIESRPTLDPGDYVGADNPGPDMIEEEYECPDLAHLNLKLTEKPSDLVIPLNTPEVSASELKVIASKAGPLFRRERIFFIEQYRRCWAGINGGHLFFYSNEKDSKPTNVIDLTGFEARPIPTLTKEKGKKREASFEIVCPGKKTLQLVARTSKDMEQWVSIISQAGLQSISEPELPLRRRQLPSIPCDEEDDRDLLYDDINSISNSQHHNMIEFEESDDEIYHDIIHTPSNGYDTDQECLYDDIAQMYPNKTHSIPEIEKRVGDKSDEKQNVQIEEEEEEEDFYDDIGVQSKLSKAVAKMNAVALQSINANVNSNSCRLISTPSIRILHLSNQLLSQQKQKLSKKMVSTTHRIANDEEYEQVNTEHK